MLERLMVFPESGRDESRSHRRMEGDTLFASFSATLSQYPLIFLAILLLRRYASISSRLIPCTFEPRAETRSPVVKAISRLNVDESIVVVEANVSQYLSRETRNSTRRLRWRECCGVSSCRPVSLYRARKMYDTPS